MTTLELQRNQPAGVPPLPITGERTLPDVPSENYWFQRHLVVYQWIASQIAGRRVIDMACGEGYGADLLAQRAMSVVGVDANPEAHEHARLRYRRENLRFDRDLIETFSEPCDVVTFLQTIEHVQDPGALLARFRELIGPSGTVFVSTPNVLTLAEPGEEKSINPWHVKEYRAAEFRELCEEHFGEVTLYSLDHARKLRVHGLLVRSNWMRVYKREGLAKHFYDWFGPRIDVRDFRLRPAPRGRDADLDAAIDFVAVCRP